MTDLDVVRVLQSVKDASDARAYYVAAWVCAFLAALQFDAASRREDTAIMDELEALRARLACRDPSPALLAARLDVLEPRRRPVERPPRGRRRRRPLPVLLLEVGVERREHREPQPRRLERASVQRVPLPRRLQQRRAPLEAQLARARG